jgi:hypothetical protein
MEMLEMRVLVAAILFVALGSTGVRAADHPVGQLANYSNRSFGIGDRTGMLMVYDFQPGVHVRSYWLAPWRHRHYYPRTGVRPKIGRNEHLSAPSHRRMPAATYQRSWSTSAAIDSELLPLSDGPRHSVPLLNPDPLK